MDIDDIFYCSDLYDPNIISNMKYSFILQILSLDISIFKSPKLKRSFPKSIESDLVAKALSSLMDGKNDQKWRKDGERRCHDSLYNHRKEGINTRSSCGKNLPSKTRKRHILHWNRSQFDPESNQHRWKLGPSMIHIWYNIDPNSIEN